MLNNIRSAPIRRFALILGSALPLFSCIQTAPDQTAAVVRRADTANQAFMRGDMRRWYDLVSPIAEDFTLMQPFGGATSHGFDSSEEHLNELARRFRNGVGTLEIEQTYATRDMIVLVMIERQRGEVGGLPEQDWSLRVTQIYRRDGNAWSLIHRHADPLTRNIGLDRAAALARDGA